MQRNLRKGMRWYIKVISQFTNFGKTSVYNSLRQEAIRRQ